MRAWSLAVLSPIQKYSLLYSKILKQKLKNLRALRSFSEVGKKNIRIDVEKMQEKLAVGLKELPEGYGQENYFFLLNMMSDIDQQLNHSLKKKFFGEYTLELLCNDMKTMDDISNIMTANINLLL